jgi:hypothetical protein
MKFLTLLKGCRRVLKIPVLTLSSALVVLTTSPILAQESPSGEDPIRTQLSQTDLEVVEELVEIAQRNSPAVRDARDAMGITPFMDAITIEIVPKDYTTFTTDPSDPSLPRNYRYHESGIDLSATINPLYIIRGIQQQSALRAHLRDARRQVRYTVMESYVAYLQADQTAETAQRRYDTVVASLPQTQVASAQLQPGQVPDPSLLANNEDYVAAATELFNANTAEIMALEGLAVAVGMSSEDTLELIMEHQEAAGQREPTQDESTEEPTASEPEDELPAASVANESTVMPLSSPESALPETSVSPSAAEAAIAPEPVAPSGSTLAPQVEIEAIAPSSPPPTPPTVVPVQTTAEPLLNLPAVGN